MMQFFPCCMLCSQTLGVRVQHFIASCLNHAGAVPGAAGRASAEFIARREAGQRIAVFLDYDGTLTPIVKNPDKSLHVRSRCARKHSTVSTRNAIMCASHKLLTREDPPLLSPALLWWAPFAWGCGHSYGRA